MMPGHTLSKSGCCRQELSRRSVPDVSIEYCAERQCSRIVASATWHDDSWRRKPVKRGQSARNDHDSLHAVDNNGPDKCRGIPALDGFPVFRALFSDVCPHQHSFPACVCGNALPWKCMLNSRGRSLLSANVAKVKTATRRQLCRDTLSASHGNH